MTEYCHSGGDKVPKLQDYKPKKCIDGVVFPSIAMFPDDSGIFAELARCGTDANPKVRQVNYSKILPGAVKAFHLHYHQTDWWFVPPGERLLVGLSDERPTSPTFGVSMRFVLGEFNVNMVKIPPGVAHGLANSYKNYVNMIYLVDQYFNPEDEYRLPWDMLGTDFWELKRE